MPRPTHFEIPVDNPDRAERFYSEIFGWTFQRYEGAPSYYGMATTGETNPGINGALFQRGDHGVVTLTMDVPSIEDAIRDCERNTMTAPPGFSDYRTNSTAIRSLKS